MIPIKHYKNISLNPITENCDGIIYIEEWKPIKNYEGLYEISNFGRIKSLARRVDSPTKGYRYTETYIKPPFMDKGYLRVELSKNGINNKYSVHRLVANHFIPNPENKRVTNHKKGFKYDNRVWELEWATDSENRQHALKVLKVKVNGPKYSDPTKHPMYGKRGALAPSSKPIICIETNKKYDCIKDASDDLGIPKTTIKYYLSGKGNKYKKFPYSFKLA